MNFSSIAIATSIAAALLGVGWLLAGRLLLKRWGIEANPTGLLVGRRLGAVYLGIALMLFLGRSAPASEFRSVVCMGMFMALVLLAGLGLIEFKAHRAGPAILLSVVLEVILAGGFASVLLA